MIRSVLLVLTLTGCVRDSRGGDLDDEIDSRLAVPAGDLKAESRYSFVTSSFYDFIKNINLISYGSSGYYLTFPEKSSSSIFYNGTTSTVFPITYTLAGAALIAYVSSYLLSFIPVGGTVARFGEDEYEDSLGYGLQRDTEIIFDEFGNEINDYDYQYPDSIDFHAFSAASEPKVSTRKVNGELLKRKGEGRSMPKKNPKALQRPGMFEDLSNKFWSLFASPVERAGETLTQGNGISGFFQRYEDYWKRRRSGFLRRSSAVEENTFRNKRKEDVQTTNHNGPPPQGKPQSYYNQPPQDYQYSNNQDNQYSNSPGPSGPSWPGQPTGNTVEHEDSNMSGVYDNHFNVEEAKASNTVEYVYSQK